MNRIYRSLSARKPLANSYSLKFLFIAFLGIHIPLIGLIVFLISSPNSLTPLTVLLITLGLTLLATGGTLFVLNNLLEPLHASKKALDLYLKNRTLPNLPVQYKDEAGILMARVQQTVGSLDTLLEEKKDLIGLLSHDLRTPLASILLLSRGMERQDDMSDAERKEIAAMISASAVDQMGLFQRVLEILRNDDIQALQLQIEKNSVENLIQSALKDVQPLADKKEISIKTSIPADQSVAVDAKLMMQVLKNLVSNAIKFSHPGSSIEIGAKTERGATNIWVSDKGLGFNPEDAAALFERFGSKRKAGTSNEVSTGMGLYLSNKIVKAHNGKITATSPGINQGSVFSVAL